MKNQIKEKNKVNPVGYWQKILDFFELSNKSLFISFSKYSFMLIISLGIIVYNKDTHSFSFFEYPPYTLCLILLFNFPFAVFIDKAYYSFLKNRLSEKNYEYFVDRAAIHYCVLQLAAFPLFILIVFIKLLSKFSRHSVTLSDDK